MRRAAAANRSACVAPASPPEGQYLLLKLRHHKWENRLFCIILPGPYPNCLPRIRILITLAYLKLVRSSFRVVQLFKSELDSVFRKLISGSGSNFFPESGSGSAENPDPIRKIRIHDKNVQKLKYN